MLNLADFAVSPTMGFLPDTEPTRELTTNQAWHALAAGMPKYLPGSDFKARVEQLPDFVPTAGDLLAQEIEMRTISYIGHGYIWGEATIPSKLPANLSKAWVTVAQGLGRHPILSYPSYCLFNWRRLDPTKPPVLGNIAIIQNFLGGLDEDWFILIHVDIEYHAAQGMAAVPACLEAAANSDTHALAQALKQVGRSLDNMLASMHRMPEGCDPYIYYNRVRPYIFGTKNNPALPNGLVYTGQFGDQPQFFRGETGAQSAIVPTLDGLLGVHHQDDPLKEYLLEMREYMPVQHRKFLETVEQQSSVRGVLEANTGDARLVAAYNHCIDQLFNFRAKHLEYAASYIHKQSLSANNSTAVGTGGTPFMTYLAKHREETLVKL